MERKKLEDLEKWLNKKNRKPLLLWGARQVGKTYLLKNIFAEQFFKGRYIYIDCRTEYQFTEYCETHVNARDVLNYISLLFEKKIDENTLIIFDEAQECLPLITLMKYFCQDFREIPIIVTGSMVRIKIKRETKNKGFLFPTGKINELTLYPLTFEEFLFNTNPMLLETIKEAYFKREPLEISIHELAMNSLYKYLFLGGMPEVVQTYIDTGDLFECREVLKELYNNYLMDMELYQVSRESIIRSIRIFNTIYAQLNKDSKNFKSGAIEKGKRTRDMESPLDWLTLAYVVHKSYQLKEYVTVPLIENDDSLFRLYLADTGMFAYQSGIAATTYIDGSAKNTLSGIIYENYVANEMFAKEMKLFYWTGKGSAEFEFLIESGGTLIPVDVKKGRGVLNSLEKYRNHNACKLAIKFSANQYGYDGKNQILTIPLYQVFLALESLKNNTLIIPANND